MKIEVTSLHLQFAAVWAAIALVAFLGRSDKTPTTPGQVTTNTATIANIIGYLQKVPPPPRDVWVGTNLYELTISNTNQVLTWELTLKPTTPE